MKFTSQHKVLNSVTAALLIAAISAPPSFAAKSDPNSPLTIDQQKQLKRAANYAKSGRKDKAGPIFDSILSTCSDLPKCLEVAGYTEQYGHQLVDVRRSIMQKALELSRTREDFILVAMKSRQYECYDVTRQAIQKLIAVSQTKEELTDLAHKAMEVSLNDVAHLAMEKEYTIITSVPDALNYAQNVSALGMDDLLRKVVKDMIDDEPNAHQLCLLLGKIEVYKLKDLNRYLLKKALDQAATNQEFSDIWEASRRHNQKDIFDVAAYRGKKLLLLQRIQKDRAAHREKVEDWKQQQDSNQQQIMKNMGSGGGGGGPQSGF